MPTSSDVPIAFAACTNCQRPTAMTPELLAKYGVTLALCDDCKPTVAEANSATEEVARRLRVDVVVTDERCEAVYEQQNADEVREAWDADRPARDREREQARARLTWGQRLDVALAALEATSTVGASPVERASKTTDDSERDPGPPKASHPDVSQNLTVIGFHVRRIEHTLDQERGLTRPGAGGLMTEEELDKELWVNFLGVHADLVSQARPQFGSPRTVMRARQREAARRKLKVSPTYGTVLGKVIEGA
jgi:hypothetical protein